MVSIVVLVFLIIGILLYRKYLYYKKLRKLNEDGLMIQPRTIPSHLDDNNHWLNIGNGGSDGTANNKNNAHFNDSTVVGSGIDYNGNSLGSTKKLPNKPPDANHKQAINYGAFAVWEELEIKRLLGEKDLEIFCWHFGVKPNGNVDPAKDIQGESKNKYI
ncbi:6463_t:CDS:2 [Entrophospora sp. SA101]|nr:6463_t:CDS:2 [Entrophospora sp. SA101]